MEEDLPNLITTDSSDTNLSLGYDQGVLQKDRERVALEEVDLDDVERTNDVGLEGVDVDCMEVVVCDNCGEVNRAPTFTGLLLRGSGIGDKPECVECGYPIKVVV